jgi:hypothetical protein
MAMYRNYDALLDDLATAMGWSDHQLDLGEDISYGNMVACPSARWINRANPDDPDMPPMTTAQQKGIVNECFHQRRYFLRQLFQSLPAVLMVFSQATTDAFLGEMQGRFSQGNPRPGDRIADLLNQNIRLRYGTLPDGTVLEARVIFSPHITGTPAQFEAARAKVLAQLVEEAQAGRIQLNPHTKHLRRTVGSCVFCPVLEIGRCDYEAELRPLAPGGVAGPDLLAAGATEPDAVQPLADKRAQHHLIEEFLTRRLSDAGAPLDGPQLTAAAPDDLGWELSGDPLRETEIAESDR